MCVHLNIENINKTIHNIINKNYHNHILVAISGGQDSMCLIKFMQNLKKQYKLTKKLIHTEYIYIDHQWKSNSKQQIQHIIHYLDSIKEPISIYQIKNITTSENQCRIYRYHIIIEHAIKFKKSIIITAHTKTDKIETFFINLFRGTGIEGITSLNIQRKLKQGIDILRPLITTTRENSLWTCKEFHMPVWSDTSNYNYHIKRNRMRYELMPYLKNYFNKKIEYNINYLLKVSYYENEYVKQSVVKLYLNSIHKKYIGLNHHKIIKQSFIIQIKIIKFFLFHNTRYNLQTQKIIRIIETIKNYKINSYINFKNLKFYITKNWIYVTIKTNTN